MALFNSIVAWVMKKRIHQIELFMKYPHEVQQELFQHLVQKAAKTQFGLDHGFSDLSSIRDFQNQVPVVNYEQLYPYIQRVMKGEQNVLWPSEIRWFAKSSGTTNDRSKFIPVSPEALEDCHIKGGKDMLSIYFNNYPDSTIFSGKNLVIGGSHQVNQMDSNANSYYGDVSAVLISNLPWWAQMVRTPPKEVALMDEWESKLEKMASITSKEDVTSISGVPTWSVVLLEKILEDNKLDTIFDVWPNLQVFFHGAVAFGPYRNLFKRLIPSDQMNYMETYNASEGFFGIQDQKNSDEILLMLDYGIFYEFIPMDELGKDHPRALTLDQVELGQIYAMVITTNAGLWRYKIGDTVQFTSLEPFRIKIAGRTKHFINAFGEELMIGNAETAITQACKTTEAEIENFTAAPHYLDAGKKGGHEWAIEFKKSPDDLDRFTRVLDEKLREVNSDYDAKRHRDIALIPPIIHQLPEGSFRAWMKKRGKLGGQNKVPRLSNDRKYLEDLLELIEPQVSSSPR